MSARPWIKDLVFVALCTSSLVGLVASFALPSRAASLEVAARSEDASAEIARVAAAVDARLASDPRASGVARAERAPTLTVVRRLSLALTGTIPSLEELRALEQVPEDRAIAWWVDHLLADRRSADYLAERFARALVGVDGGSFISYRRRRFVAWLSEQLAEGRTWDAIASDMLTGTGLWTQHPQTNFVTAAIKPDTDVPDEQVLAGRVSRALLGVRLDCAQCHDHPFDERWQQRDFQGLAAFFGRAQLSLRGIQETRGDYGYDDHASKQRQTIAPQVPFAPELLPEHGGDRERLAAWLTHPKNPAFARATVNRVWALLLGRALVEPVDDLPIDGPVDPVLELLAADFAEHGYDLRRLIRIIAQTEVMARASRMSGEVSEGDAAAVEARIAAWAEFPLTRLRPEQVVGAVLQATSITTLDHESHVLIRLARRLQRQDFIDRYGDAGEDELEQDAGTIPQRLLLLNGELVDERTKDNLVANASTRIATLTDDDAVAIEAAYLAVLTRAPTFNESTHFLARLDGLSSDARREAIEDLYWALLNSTEFAWNH